MKSLIYVVVSILALGSAAALPAQAAEYREVTDSLTGATLKNWNEGNCESFRVNEVVRNDRAPRYANATAPLSWNHVVNNARFTSIGDTVGSNARISAVADFKTDFVTCRGKPTT